MNHYLEKIGNGIFIAVIAIFGLYLASDLFGVIRFSRETGHLILISVLVGLPGSLVVFGALNWFYESSRQFFYLQVVAALNLIMAAIIYLVMNSGI